LAVARGYNADVDDKTSDFDAAWWLRMTALAHRLVRDVSVMCPVIMTMIVMFFIPMFIPPLSPPRLPLSLSLSLSLVFLFSPPLASVLPLSQPTE
jgi:hypothetical protein